jgi:hypothetical protein
MKRSFISFYQKKLQYTPNFSVIRFLILRLKLRMEK